LDQISGSLYGLWTRIKNFSGGALTDNTLTAITIGIIGVLALVIIWLVWGIAKDVRGGGKKPEKMEKQVAVTVCKVDEDSDALGGIDRL
jgi:hypothetical protein